MFAVSAFADEVVSCGWNLKLQEYEEAAVVRVEGIFIYVVLENIVPAYLHNYCLGITDFVSDGGRERTFPQ